MKLWAFVITVSFAMLAAAPARAQFPAQEPPCMKDFSPLREDASKKARAVTEAGQRKAPPKETCPLFNAFAAAEAKLIKYAEENGTWCGIPPEVVKQMKTNHVKTRDIRGKVCAAAVRPAGPAAPSLSDALGATRVPNAETVKPGRGTFDTLTGTPLGNR
jgi:hypothetical protein